MSLRIQISMSKSRLNQNTFSLRSVLCMVSLLAIAFSLLGVLMRYQASERADSAKKHMAHEKHASTIADQIAATAGVLENEKRRIEATLGKTEGYQLQSSCGKFENMSGWEYQLRVGSPGEVVVDVTASANIVNGNLTPITIFTNSGAEDERIVGLLAPVYTEAGWKVELHKRAESLSLERKTRQE